jgi:hypothetical protein
MKTELLATPLVLKLNGEIDTTVEGEDEMMEGERVALMGEGALPVCKRMVETRAVRPPAPGVTTH